MNPENSPRPTLILELNSTQMPETRPKFLASTSKEQKILDAIEGKYLILYPGEPNELQVRVENTGDRSLDLTFYVEFENPQPKTWFRGWSSGDDVSGEAEPTLHLELAAGSQQFLGLHFTLPDGFFESEDAIDSVTPTVALEHAVTLEVYRGDRQTGTLVGYRPFQLEIRPRSSYIHFLPALYRQVDFVDRFLKIMEETFDPALQTSDCLWAYLDPLTAPEALLPFLAHWVGAQLDPRLDELAQRQLIRHAVQLYRWRGTRAGLRLYLHLATGLPLEGDAIEITADLNAGFVLGNTRFDRSPRLGGGKAYHFRVCLRPEAELPLDESIVREIIQQYKPALSTYELTIRSRDRRE